MVDERKKWERVADQLRQEIAAGTYPVGKNLPGVRQLVEQFAVSEDTVSRALRELQAERLIRGEVGAGTRVIGTPDRPAVSQEAMIEALLARVDELEARVRQLEDRDG